MTHTPAFVVRMNAVFASERSNQFLVTGNIHDLVDASSLDQPSEPWLPVVEYLEQRLVEKGHAPVRFHVGGGIRFAREDDRLAAQRTYAEGSGKRAESFDRVLMESRSDAGLALQVLAELTRLTTPRPITVIIRYTELLVPEGEPGQLSDPDRRRLAIMRDWLSDPRFLAHRGALILLAETAAGVNARVRTMPHLTQIEVPLPEVEERRRYIDESVANSQRPILLGESTERMAQVTAGMGLTDLRSLFLDARFEGTTLDRSTILGEVNRLVQARIGNHLEIIEPAHQLSDVIGQTALKQELERQRRLMDLSDPSLAPVGILAAGPNGTGKTFTYFAWAADCQRLVVVLKNLRGSYFGETDRIFEQVRGVLEALGNVIVIIDEADTQFGAPGGQTHDTEARLFGSLIRMMGDPENRGKIVWVLITARPERLAPDLKRSGRAGLHLPVFDPEGDDRTAFVNFVLHRAGVGDMDPATRGLLDDRTAGFSPADFNELATALRAERALGATLDAETINRVLNELVPIDIAAQRRRQTLQALMHCSRQGLIPPSLAKLDRDEARRELSRLGV